MPTAVIASLAIRRRTTGPRSSLRLTPDTWRVKNLQPTWPAGAKFLEKNFALDKGRIVRGQVIDAETKQPIAGAAVAYQPRHGNPTNRREYDFSDTVLTRHRRAVRDHDAARPRIRGRRDARRDLHAGAQSRRLSVLARGRFDRCAE